MSHDLSDAPTRSDQRISAPLDTRRSRERGRRHLQVRARDGLRLAVCDWSPAHAEATVVFLHGWCLSELAWRNQKARLQRHHGAPLRLISIDHRGHGRSDPAPLHTCRIEQLADDLAVVLDELSVRGPVTLVGHSMGAMVAIEYALRPQGQRPVEAGGLVLVASAAGKLAQRGLGRLLNTPATSALVTALAHTPEHLLRMMAGPVCAAVGRYCGCGRTERATVSALATAALATTPVTTAIGFLPSLRDWDRTAALGDVRARTVVVSGGNDLLTPVAHAQELAAGIPGAAHLHVPEAGHMLPQQAPEVLDEAIRAVISAPNLATLAGPAGPVSAAAAPAGDLRRAHA